MRVPREAARQRTPPGVPATLISLLACCLTSTCATPSPTPAPVPADTVPVRFALTEGATVLVRAEEEDGLLLPLLREGLGQSPFFRFTTEEQPAAATVVVRAEAEPDGAALFATIQRPLEPPVSLAGARGRRHLDAVDHLCRRVRTALGEPAESVERTAMPAALAYSNDPETVRRTEGAAAELRNGDLALARSLLERALKHDPGCAVAGAMFAGLLVDLGDVEKAQQAARKFAALDTRTTPTTAHRLERTIALARRDHGALIALGEQFMARRRYDPEGSLTKAFGLSFTGRLEEALPILQALTVKMPSNQVAKYLEGWARLGTGDAASALERFQALAVRMSPAMTVLPRAYALFALGRLDELERMLEQLARTSGAPVSARFELLLMRSSAALLRGDAKEGGDRALAAVDLLRSRAARPPTSAGRGAALAELGEVLVHLGRGEDLVRSLEAFGDDTAPPKDLEAAMTWLSALAGARGGAAGTRPAAAAVFSATERPAWASALEAKARRAAGDLQGEVQRRRAVVDADPSPFHRMQLAQAAERADDPEAAAAQRKAVAAWLGSLDLRHLDRHPLAHPGHALAWKDAGAASR